MECEINGKTIKYEDGKLYSFYNNKWRDLKGSIDEGYKRVQINGKTYYYHRVIYYLHNPEWNIYDNSKKNQIDHIDRNKLNNNIENLRVVTHQQNQFNKDAKGYSWHKRDKKYQASIGLNGKVIHLGCYDNEEDARNCYLEAKEKYHFSQQLKPNPYNI